MFCSKSLHSAGQVDIKVHMSGFQVYQCGSINFINVLTFLDTGSSAEGLGS